MGARISVAVVTYNGERFIQEQLASIVAQRPSPFEIVVADDGSTDRTREVVAGALSDAPFSVRIIGGDHVGLRRNIERAIEACHGSVIALSDQDDVWLPGKIAAIQEAFDDPAVTLWFSDAEMSDESGEPRGDRLWDHVTLHAEEQALIMRGGGLSRLIHGQTVTGATMAFRSDLRGLVLPLPTELELDGHIYLHDGWIAVLASLMGRCVLDPVPRVRYRQHGRQVTKSVSPRREGPAHALGLVADGRLTAEYARAHLVLMRLRERDALAKCRPADAATLRDLDTLLRARTMPPGAARVRAILREFAVGNYSRHARGFRTACGDLLLRRGIRATPAVGSGGR